MLGREARNDDSRRIGLRATLAALLLSLAGLVGVALQFASAAQDTLEEVSHQAVLSQRSRQLQRLLLALTDAETGQRGYLLTGDERYLAPYRSAVAQMPALMKALDEAGMTDPEFAQKAGAARALIADKLSELDQTVRLQASGRHAEALALVGSDKGLDFMERARGAIDEATELVRAERDRIGTGIGTGVERIRWLLGLAVSSLVVFVLLGLLQVLQTLAARTRAQSLLVESERRHRALVEDQSELVALSREDGRLVYVNPAFARHYDRAPEDLLGKNRFELLPEAERDAARLDVSVVLRTGRDRRTETRTLAEDGSERWVSWTNKRLQEAEGALLHSVGRDVTERKRSDRALRASQSFLHRTSRIAGVGGWERDLVTGAGIWSDEVRRILEVPEDYVPSKDDTLASYAPGSREQAERAFADCVERGIPWDLELQRFTATGKRIWVRVVGSLEFENGQPRRVVGALQDVTERKQLEERLAESERFLRQITDSLQVRIAYFDTYARYRFVNLAHCRRYGRRPEQVLGRTRAEIAGRHDPAVEARIAAVLRGEPQEFEYDEMLESDRAPRRIQAYLLPDVDEHGEVRGFYGTGVDITERVAVERRLRELTQILELTPDFIAQVDPLGAVVYANPALRRALGLEPDAPLEGLRAADFRTPQSEQRDADEIAPALRENGSWLGETALRLEGGREVPVAHLAIAHRDARGRLELSSEVLRDISAEVAAREALRLQTATLQSVTEALPAMVAVIGRDGRYRFVNTAFERWADLPRELLLGRKVQEVVSAEEYAARRPWIERALAGESVDFELSSPTRRVRDLALTYIPLRKDGAVDGYVAVAQDITTRREETVRLMQLTQRDALTGVLNRAGFEDWLARREAEGEGGALAVLYIDLDHFKPVNDTFGHRAGDSVLQLFARRLLELVRPVDGVARLGGDEFALALAGVREREHAQAVAAKVVAAAALPFAVGALQLLVGASVGVAWQDGRGGWQGLVEHADGMLYRAKAAGRGTYA